ISCVTEKKARNWAYSHKEKLAEWCADCFPVKPSEVIKGDTITIVDSVVRVDSIRVQVDCTDGTKADCPPNKTITKEIKTHSTDTIKIRDTAFEYVLETKVKEVNIENDKLKKDLDDMTSSRDK